MEQTAIAPPHGSDSPKKAKQRRRRNWLPFWLILPTVLVLLAIQVYPVFYTLVLSVQQRQTTGWEFVGLQNFEILLGSRSLGESAGHTLIFLVGYVSLTLALGFFVALLLNRKSKLSGVYITLLFIPWILADIIAGRRGLPAAGLARLRAFLRHPAEPGVFPAQRVIDLDRGCGEAVGRRLSLPALPGHDLPDPGRHLARAALHHAAVAGRVANGLERGDREQPHRRREPLADYHATSRSR